MADRLPISVWPCAQQPARIQRRDRYVAESTAHPGKMLPELARRAIEAFSRPRDIVLDPMCGIGTSLVEAVHLNRDAIGVEYESRWAALAEGNVALAEALGATGRGNVWLGDARQMQSLLPRTLHGRCALVLTSPPYGSSVHGQVRVEAGMLVKSHVSYSDDSGNLAHVRSAELTDALREIFATCITLLRPGGIAAVTTRPWRRDGLLTDFPGAVLAAARVAGFVPLQRLVALLAGVSEGRLVPRASFFQLQQVRKARAAGLPLRVIAHEDVLVLRKP